MTFKKLFIGLALTASGLLAHSAMAQDSVAVREISTQKLAGVEVKNNSLVDVETGEVVRALPKHRGGSRVTEVTNLHLAATATRQSGHHAKVIRKLEEGKGGVASTNKASGDFSEHSHANDKKMGSRNSKTSLTIQRQELRTGKTDPELREARKHTLAHEYGVPGEQTGKAIVMAGKQVGNHAAYLPRKNYQDNASTR